MADFAPVKGMSAEQIDATIDAIMAEATLAEKVGMLSGKGFFAAFMADERVWRRGPIVQAAG
jgi:beta-glucosidase